MIPNSINFVWRRDRIEHIGLFGWLLVSMAFMRVQFWEGLAHGFLGELQWTWRFEDILCTICVTISLDYFLPPIIQCKHILMFTRHFKACIDWHVDVGRRRTTVNQNWELFQETVAKRRPVSYSRIPNRHRAGNKRRARKICQK